MGLMIGWFSFDGPLFTIDEVPENSGVFAVLSLQGENEYMMLGIEESENMRQAISAHEKTSCWQDNCKGRLCYMVYGSTKMSPQEREKIVREVRMQYEMPCSPSATPEHGYWTQ